MRTPARRQVDTPVVLAEIHAKPKPVKQPKPKRRGLLITPADKWFSLCVRERANWTCERCGKHYEPPTSALQCSHFIGRGNWSVRFIGLNGDSLCYGCHSYFEGNPQAYLTWKREKLGEERYQLLVALSNTRLGKQAHKQVQDIAAHYRHEFEVMKGLRAQGCSRWIELDDWFAEDILILVIARDVDAERVTA